MTLLFIAIIIITISMVIRRGTGSRSARAATPSCSCLEARLYRRRKIFCIDHLVPLCIPISGVCDTLNLCRIVSACRNTSYHTTIYSALYQSITNTLHVYVVLYHSIAHDIIARYNILQVS